MESIHRFLARFRQRAALILAVSLMGMAPSHAAFSNVLSYGEILDIMESAVSSQSPEDVPLAVFEAFDTDQDDLLSGDEITAGIGFGDLFSTRLHEAFDWDGGGSITPFEWSNRWALWEEKESTIFLVQVPDAMANIPLNELQCIGSHNSYHIQPVPELDVHYYGVEPDLTQSIRYSHPPLAEQFSVQEICQIELDILADPDGGRYAEPWGPLLVRAITTLDEDLETVIVIPYDEEELVVMQEPGLKVLHLQDLDYGTTCYTLQGCLSDIKAWSDDNPGHHPIFVLIEAKDEAIFVEMLPDHPWNNPPPIDATMLAEIDSDILSVFGPERLLTPADVRGDYPTLREAILAEGWPTLEESAGTIYFGLDNGGTPMETYLALHPDLSSQILFTSSPLGDDRAAFVKRNDPYASDIAELAELGYLIRTRADYDTVQSVQNDHSQKEQAFASGAHFISTDYRVPDTANSDYSVGFENDAAMRCNVINGDGACSALVPEPGSVLLQLASLVTLLAIRRASKAHYH